MIVSINELPTTNGKLNLQRLSNGHNPLKDRTVPEDLRINLEIPPEFLRLRRNVLNCTVLDELQGWMLKEWTKVLIMNGVPPEQAKHMVNPESPGRSFAEVWKRAKDLPTVTVMGGAGFRWRETPGFEEFTLRIHTIMGLLGISNANGGGPGVMELSSTVQQVVAQVLDNECRELELKRRFNAETLQVLLLIGAEQPNLKGKEEFRVWAIDQLKARTPMLYALGTQLALLFYPGGFGTLEELSRALVDDQLHDHVVTAVQNRMPILLLDFEIPATESAPAHRRWDGLLQLIEDSRRDGSISVRNDTMSRVKRIRTEDPKAAEVVTSHIDESARGILGFSLVEEWEEENGRDLFETAEDILPTVEREFSRSYSQ